MMLRSLAFLLLLAAAPAGAQSVADYYHTAAQSYIGGQNAEAEQAAEAGLAIDPTNEKLRALLEKIRERKPQNGGEQEQEDAEQQEPGESEQQEDAEGGEEENEAESEGEQQPQSEQSQQHEGDQQQPEEPSEQVPQDESEGDTGAEGEQDPSDPQGGGTTEAPFEVKPGEMSRAEAERILRAIESDELELLRDVQRRRARPRYVEKDW